MKEIRRKKDFTEIERHGFNSKGSIVYRDAKIISWESIVSGLIRAFESGVE